MPRELPADFHLVPRGPGLGNCATLRRRCIRDGAGFFRPREDSQIAKGSESEFPTDIPRTGNAAWIINIGIALAFVAAAATVCPWDQRASGLLVQLPIGHTPFSRTVKLLGKFDVAFSLMLLACWAMRNTRMLGRFVLAITGCGVVVSLLKVIVARVRPDGGPFSFPSGDTSVAFVWAAILAAEYPFTAVPALLIAATVGLLRAVGGRHYPSDVLAGAAVGFASAGAALYAVRNEAPRWLHQATRRTWWGVIVVAACAGCILAQAIGGNLYVILLAAIAAVVVTAPILVRRYRGRPRGGR